MSDVKSRIRKLRAVANDPSVTEAEAAAFAAKAAQLLIESGLSEAELANRTECDIVDVCVREARCSRWLIFLSVAVAESHMCTMYLRSGVKLHFVGRPMAVETAKETLEYLVGIVRRMSRGYSAEKKQQDRFKLGCALRICEKLRETVKTTLTGRELVLCDSERSAAEEWLKQQTPNIRKRRAKRVMADSDFMSGWQAGDSVAVRREVQ